MADYAVMPYTDYEDACNAVREKTGGTANIKSGEMGAQIRAIDTQEDLSPELTAQDTLIADIITALEGKMAASGPEVVTGVYNFASEVSGSITIPGLIGKNNFSLIYLGSVDWDDITGMKMLAVHLTGGANGQIVYGCHIPEEGYHSDTGNVGLGATAWDSSTGTLTRTIAPSNFPDGDWSYIGW